MTAACQASLSITSSWSLPYLCPLCRWCHPTISSSVDTSPPALNLSQHQGLFKWFNPLHQVANVLEFQLQHQSFQWTPRDWSLLGWTGWTSLQSKGLSRVFSNTTVQKHQFFSAQLSSQSNSHIHTWPLEKGYGFSLISNCLNLLVETQGKSWRLNEAYFL